MNKSAIKNYAVAARRKLIDAVQTKMVSLSVYIDGAADADVALAKLRADGVFLTRRQMEARAALCNHLARLSDDMDQETAYNHVLEEVAYTWFNRLIALRYMEVNGYLPSGIRILSSTEPGRVEPDAMREAERLPFVNANRIDELRMDTSPGASEKLYKYILISQCNTLHEILPGMFQKINDYTELLLPDTLYQRGCVVHDLVNAIDEEDFKEQVQIIGWLYQYYISEKKDEAFANLKKNIKINKETIPAATQLFTPEWIVRYMVENSLGRLWLEHLQNEDGLSFPTSFPINFSDSTRKITELRSNWKYYVEEAEQEPEVQEQLKELRKSIPIEKPEDIKLIDPCMGSGHILVYAFDVLYQIYLSQGYAERDIPNLILNYNLFGLDIDERAAQLAYFALMMKARSYNRSFFRQDSLPRPHVRSFIESDGVKPHHLDLFGQGLSKADQAECKEDFEYLLELFKDARELGSIIKIEKAMDFDKLRRFVEAEGELQMVADVVDHAYAKEVLLGILDAAEIIAHKYDVVVTNPPYMGGGNMGTILSKYVKSYYPDSKSDMSTVFMEKALNLCHINGLLSMINIPVWMFLSSYEKLRQNILTSNTLTNMLHFGRGVFGSDFGSTAFVLRKQHFYKYTGCYHRLFLRQGSVDSVETKEKWFLKRKGFHLAQQEAFTRIPSSPIVYWANKSIYRSFSDNKPLSHYMDVRSGISTGDNNLFYRYWFECNIKDISFDSNSTPSNSNHTWFPTIRGGDYRKWYGNMDNVLNLKNDSFDIRNSGNNYRLRTPEFYNKSGITWNRISASIVGFRIKTEQVNFGENSPCMFVREGSLLCILGYLNSKLAINFLLMLNPTMTYQVIDIQNLPYAVYRNENAEKIISNNISISKLDWDSFETSWDFKRHPLVEYGTYGSFAWGEEASDKFSGKISRAYQNWKQFAIEQFIKLKSNEEELNRIFIDIYGLQDELTPEVADKDITVHRIYDTKADVPESMKGSNYVLTKQDVMKSFISYVVGCMFGRYSPDEPGLVFAGGTFDMSRYHTYIPEDDNILPINDNDYFPDDIVVRFVDFVRIVYASETLDENLMFIADALYPDANGTALEKIRRYFVNDFYKDHVKLYKKHPIYWLMDSGKKNGFKALCYLHRYNQYTVAQARTDYLHPLQRKYEAEISRLEMLVSTTESARESAAYRKEADVLKAKIDECLAYDQVVAYIAHQQIELDLDDGVKVNYAKFQGVEVPKSNGKTEKMDLLGKI